MADLGAYFGNPNLQRQVAKARALAEKRDVNTLADPRTYAAVQGLLGTAPDQMGFSVLHPDYEKIKKVADPAFALGLLGQASPLLAPLTKGLPVGASIKNVGDDLLSYRGSHKAPSPDFGAPLHDLTGGGQMYPADVYSAKATQFYGTGYPKADKEAFDLAKRVRGNPDAEVTMYRAVPKDENIKTINAGDWVTLSKDYAKTHGESVLQGDYKIISQKVKAKELWTNADSIHEFGYQPQKKATAPQQEALDTAQRNAALPIEEGGLGLPKDNTQMDRAKAMGFDIDAFHGSKDPSIMAFDPALVGKSTSNVFDKNIWATSSPEVARGYSLDTKQFDLLPQAQEIKSKIADLSKKYNAAYDAGKFDEMDSLREQINFAQNESKDLYKSFLSGDIASEGSTIYPLMMRSSDLMPYEAEGKNWMRVNAKAIDEAKQQGYGGVQINNVSDNTQASSGIRSNTYATENPELIRSRFAAFDPMRRNEADILAGVLPLGLLADEEQRKKIYELMPSLLGE